MSHRASRLPRRGRRAPAQGPIPGWPVREAGARRSLGPADLPARPTPVNPGLLEADDAGRWGCNREFGGRYVPETLMAALEDLQQAYDALRHDPRFWAEFRSLLATYSGRPTPLYRADRLAEEVLAEAGAWSSRLVAPVTGRCRPACGSTSSARTSATPAPTRSTTPWARRS